MPADSGTGSGPAGRADGRARPTVELHRHFEAGLRPDTIARLAQRHGVTEVRTRKGVVVPRADPQNPASIRQYYRGIAEGFGRPDGFSRFADSFASLSATLLCGLFAE